MRLLESAGRYRQQASHLGGRALALKPKRAHALNQPLSKSSASIGVLARAEYVNRLYGMVARNTTPPFTFTCFTDNDAGFRSEVSAVPLPELLRAAGHQERYLAEVSFVERAPS